jgi:hypothetical protein
VEASVMYYLNDPSEVGMDAARTEIAFPIESA